MDTHIAPSPELAEHGIPPDARLPGEPDPDTAPASGRIGPSERLATSSNKARRKGSRAFLLGGAAVVGVFVVAAGAFLLSPYNHVVPVPAQVAAAVRQVERSAGIDANVPLAPSAWLASIDPPTRPAAIVPPPYTPPPREQDLDELLSIRPGSAAAGAAQPRPKPGKPILSGQNFVPREPGSTTGSAPDAPTPASPRATDADASAARAQPVARDITPEVLAATRATDRGAQPTAAPVVEPSPPAARHVEPGAPASAPAPELKDASEPAPAPVLVQKQEQAAGASAAAPPDAVKQALRVQAAPMSDEEQVKVLELVTQIATMVRDLKSRDATLRADVAKATADNQARLADFARRIDLAEATNAVAAARGAGDLAAPSAPAVANTVVANTAAARPAMALAPAAVTRPDVAPPSTAPQDARRYRVQAASPGLALLAEVARGGGDGAQIQVTVGDVIPGWGKVKSVAQRGMSWVVSTEHGVIE